MSSKKTDASGCMDWWAVGRREVSMGPSKGT